MDLCFELAAQIMDSVGDIATVADEVHGFRYFNDRDVLASWAARRIPVQMRAWWLLAATVFMVVHDIALFIAAAKVAMHINKTAQK
jgi:hypothetical protein